MVQLGRARTAELVLLGTLACLLVDCTYTVPMLRPVSLNGDTQLQGLSGPGSITLVTPPPRPSVRLILIILRERCRQWQANGVNPLPDYCWELLGVNRGRPDRTPDRLIRYYDSYASTVTSSERQQDLLKATLEVGRGPVDGLFNGQNMQ